MTKSLQKRGYKIEDIHTSKTLTNELVNWADIILYMQPKQRQRILKKFVLDESKLKILSKQGIKDPHGKTEEFFDSVVSSIEITCKQFYNENFSSSSK